MPLWKPDWRQSLTFKLLASYLLAWMLTVALASAAFWLVLQFQTSDRARHSAERITHVVADMLVFDTQGRLLRLDWQDELQWLPEALPQDLSYQVSDN